jgi:hypothetical protein
VKRWSVLACIAACLVATACTSTTVQSTWKEPDLGRVRFSKVLVVAPMQDPDAEQIAEQVLVSRVKAGQVVAAFALFPEGVPTDVNEIKARAAALGFDGALVFRIVNEPGGLNANVRTLTEVYELPSNQLVWAGVSTTASPRQVAYLAKDASQQTAKQMRHQSLLVMR